ncbi:splicing factor U2af large subunit A-like isoform X1 [Iris pallida]|uniref:Splicing factor U2af large subunit n=1 Tax=Iris pallida TaxID=29817 RepID=A0AAX6HQT8_IRIPA|nr:splicing factor U2af large subunit A-like isoform X1 [Iris pallida]
MTEEGTELKMTSVAIIVIVGGAATMIMIEIDDIGIDHGRRINLAIGQDHALDLLQEVNEQVALTWLLPVLLLCPVLQLQRQCWAPCPILLPSGVFSVDNMFEELLHWLLDLDRVQPESIAFFGQLPGIPQAVAGIFSSMLPLAPQQFGSLSLMPAQAMTQQATRHARRVYVGGLPPMANEQTIATFFSHIMSAIGGNSAGPGDAVVNVYINHEKKFAFVEMRSVEEASNAMALDGIIFEGVSVRVRRPTDYNPSLAATLGPSHPSPYLNLAAVGLSPGAVGGAEGPDRVFVGGLPYYFTDAQIRELLESFGSLRGFDLVKDRDTGNSKGYGFCVYQDPAVTDIACAALNGLKMGDKTLTVRRATASNGPVRPEQALVLQQAQQHIALQKIALQSSGAPLLPGVGLAPSSPESLTKVVCLTEVVSIDELRDDEEYEEILQDMREEGGKFGPLVNVVIPRPSSSGEVTAGVGKVFLEYADNAGAARAKAALHGRKFGGNTVTAVHYPEDRFSSGDYGATAVV